jgi:hypothetical protein
MLKRHSRFSEDFADQMPEEVHRSDQVTQNEWLFQQAAVWPETVRSGPPGKRAFNRSEWHHVNLPTAAKDLSAQMKSETIKTDERCPKRHAFC